MMINCPLQKETVSAHTLHLHVSNTQNTRVAAPSGRDKVKSIHHDLQTFSSEKYCLANKTQKHEQKQFKIRNFNHKAGPKTTALVGKSIQQMIMVNRRDKQMNEEDSNNIIIRRVSMAGTPQQRFSKNKQKQLFKPSIHNKQKFNESINIFNTLQQTQLRFANFNLSFLLPLAHKVQVLHNPIQHASQKKIVLIVSLKLISQQAKKYKMHYRSSQHNSSVDGNFSQQTKNFLKMLSGAHCKGFLANCKLYYKVNNTSQSEVLRQYLKQNMLKNYAGIINVQDKYIESHNLYSLKGIVGDESVIVLQDRHTITQQFPITSTNQNFIFITPKTNDYFRINQMIEHLKSIQIQHNFTPLPSEKMSKKTVLTDESDKQNLHPNIVPIHIFKSPKKNSSLQSPSKSSKKKLSLNMDGKLTLKKVNIDFKMLFSKAECFSMGKQLKNVSRNKSARIQSNRSVTLRNIKERSLSKQKNETSFDQMPKVALQGQFKDKMVTFIKILQIQKKERLERSNVPQNDVRREVHNDVVQELTQNITSKLKSRTNYQMLGELLRNNSHIAKQISKYINQINPFQQILKENTDKRSNCLKQVIQEEVRPELIMYQYE